MEFPIIVGVFYCAQKLSSVSGYDGTDKGVVDVVQGVIVGTVSPATVGNAGRIHTGVVT